jgi:hypothetical protein
MGPVSISSVGAASLQVAVVKSTQTSDASKSTAIPPTGSKPVSFLADQAAASVTLSGGKKVDPSLKVNSDATLGPHRKPRHPRLPGSF